MALAVVSSVLGRIGDLLIEESKFLHGVDDQVVGLQRELIRMKCFLEDADAVRDKNKRIHNFIMEIRDLAYRSEDVVETFIFEVASRRRKGGFRNFVRRSASFFSEASILHKLGSEMETIKLQISNVMEGLQGYGIRDLTRAEGSSSAQERRLLLRRTYSHNIVEEDFVGFEEDITKLVGALVDEDKHFRAISICGMGGSGKTTLATKVYRYRDVRRHFDAFAWASISQEWKKEDVLQRILITLMPAEKTEEIRKMRDEELVRELHKVQAEKKCLVVLDDVWSTDVWDIIRSAFPNGKMGSKILLTSRYKAVAEHVDPYGFLHETRLLDDKESWELFQKKAFLRELCFTTQAPDSTINQQMELGKKMVKRCGGLPLAIVVIGGLLGRKHTLNEWQTVYQNIDSHLTRDREQGMAVLEVLALSYQDLPYWLKPCFLHLGNYPEDEVIKTEKLYQQWMAEGFISVEEEERRGKITMMEVAEHYLGELAQRCMVRVHVEDDYQTSSSSNSRRFKSCQLHDLMRDMCLSMVKQENFLKIAYIRDRIEPKYCCSSTSTSLATPSSSTPGSQIHRLAIHSNGDTDGYFCIDHEKKVRSVVFFQRKTRRRLAGEMLFGLAKNFKLVRVLDLERSFKLKALPKGIGNLIHLNYLSLRNCHFKKLPSSIGNLKYLETLDLRVHGCSLSIPNVLWKLERLRHLYLPSDYDMKCWIKLRLKGLNNLETLENLKTDHVNLKDLQKLTNLRRLTIAQSGGEEELIEISSYLRSVSEKGLLQYSEIKIVVYFDCDELLTLLRQIMLECHHVHKLAIFGFIRELPKYQQGSHISGLTRLTLIHSKLEEDPLAILEKLPNLIVLVLDLKSFVGKEMVCSMQGFPRLKHLLFWGLLQLEEWKVYKGAMSSLSTLTIGHCRKLKMVPEGLRFVTGLEELKINWMPLQFMNRLRVLDGEEGEDFDKVRHVPSITLGQDVEDNEDDDIDHVSFLERNFHSNLSNLTNLTNLSAFFGD